MKRSPLVLSATLFILPLAPALLESQTITFEPTTNIPLGHVPEPVAVGDLDGDSNLDVVIANSAAGGGAGGDSVSVLLGNGDGTFDVLGEFGVGGARPEGVLLAFIDGDSILDVVTANFEGDSVSVLLGSGTGALGAPIVTPVAGGPRFVVASDFDGDDILDLATANYDGDSVSILKGNDTGNFVITGTLGVGNGPEVIALAHLTPDANIDLVTSNAIADTVTPLQGNGAGGFAVGAPHPVDNRPRFVFATDLDGDGLDDLIVANNADHTVTLERNAGALNFVLQDSLSFDDGFISLRRPVYLDLADMNQDGIDDILVSWTDEPADVGPDLFSIFPGTGVPFEYGEPFAFAASRTPLGIVAADFNSDGQRDVLVSNAESDSASVYLSSAANPGVIVDNSTAETTEIGFWLPSTAPFPFGADSRESATTGAQHTWERDLVAAEYEVQIRWTVTNNRSPQVPVEVEHAAGMTQVVVDQTEGIGVWHSLGTFDFDDFGAVTLTVPPGGQTASADAVRFRPTAGPPNPPGNVPVIARPRPPDFRIDEDTVLAFQGNLRIQNPNDSEDWVSAVFSAVGDGDESNRISELQLFIDSNGDRSFDAGDTQLGSAESFVSDNQPLTFNGFSETLANQTSVDFFVVAKMDSSQVAAIAKPRASATPVLATGAVVLIMLLLLLLLRGKFPLRGEGPLLNASCSLVVLLALAVLPVAGCGGGGSSGGGAPPPTPTTLDLQLQLSSISTVGSTTGTPSTQGGLPVTGWNF